jgi:hypothetical protein
MEYSDDQGKMMIEHPMRSEEDWRNHYFFQFYVITFFFFTKEKKDQHFNRKKTRENHLCEGM